MERDSDQDRGSSAAPGTGPERFTRVTRDPATVPPPRGFVDGYIDGYSDGIRQTMVVFMTAMIGSLVLMRFLNRE